MNPFTLDKFLWRKAAKAPASPQTSIVKTAQATIRVRDTGGVGMPLVFLCDPPVVVEAYDELIALLAPEYRVIVVELPGFGFSQATHSQALKFTQSVDAVEAALSTLLNKPAVVFGPCICGFVATELSRRGNLPMAGVVLMQTPDTLGMQQWCEVMDPKRLLRKPYFGQLMVKAKASSLIPLWLKFATAKTYDHAGLVNTCSSALKQGGAYSLASMFQQWGEEVKDDAISLPLLIIWGQQDRSHANTDKQCSKKHAHDAELVEFEQCGHFSELEDPQAFVGVVRPFLERLIDF